MFAIWHETAKQADPKVGTDEIRPATEGFQPLTG
jgi:hypothetical protein